MNKYYDLATREAKQKQQAINNCREKYSADLDKDREKLMALQAQLEASISEPEQYKKIFVKVRELSNEIAATESLIDALRTDPVEIKESVIAGYKEAVKDYNKAIQPKLKQYVKCKSDLIGIFREILNMERELSEAHSDITCEYLNGASGEIDNQAQRIEVNELRNAKIYLLQNSDIERTRPMILNL